MQGAAQAGLPRGQQGDVTMKNVPVQTMNTVAAFSNADAKQFEAYYGVHPDNCEGAGFFRNSE